MPRRLRKRDRPALPRLYGALFEISVLRDQLAGLRELPDADAARYLARLQELEGKANRLTEHFETRRGLSAH
jgi:hypothetical protein